LNGEFDGYGDDPVSGEIFGVAFALKQLMDQIGMERALGKSKESKRGRSRSSMTYAA
jgi:hypothetical protein